MDSPEIDLSGIEVLIVDDDPAFREFVAAGLQKNRARSRCFADGESVLAALREGPIEESDCESRAAVVLLDIMMLMMPRVEGWDVLTSIRQDHPILPVILVTARESVEERVRGLRMGADDYVIKPFVFVELLARIESVCRRRTAMLHCGDLRLDLSSRVCRVRGQTLDLTPREFAVLETLLKRETVSRTEFLSLVWGVDRDPGTNTVEVHVSRLRRKLAAMGGPSIVTLRGQGYGLAPHPDEGPDS